MGMYYHFVHGVLSKYETRPRLLNIHYNYYACGNAITVPSALKFFPNNQIPQIAWIEANVDFKTEGKVTGLYDDAPTPDLITFLIEPYDLDPKFAFVYSNDDTHVHCTDVKEPKVFQGTKTDTIKIVDNLVST
jgi:hypothetical protein